MTAKNDPRNPGFKNTVLYGLRLAQHYSHSRYQLQILGAEPRSRHERLCGLEQVYQNRSGGCPAGVFWQERCHSLNVLYLELVERQLYRP